MEEDGQHWPLGRRTLSDAPARWERYALHLAVGGGVFLVVLLLSARALYWAQCRNVPPYDACIAIFVALAFPIAFICSWIAVVASVHIAKRVTDRQELERDDT